MVSRNFCFTTFKEPTIKKTDIIKYAIYQPEICPTTNKLHYQGYIELTQPARISQIKKILDDNTAHIEKRQGTRLDAINYCKKIESKAGKTVEIGNINIKQGYRSDLEEIAKKVKKGYNLQRIAEKFPTQYIKYYRGIEALKHKLEKPKQIRNVTVEVITGPSGSGKTQLAIEKSDGDYFKLNENSNGTLWFDGYEGEKTLIIDDFYGWIKWGELLTLIDKYPYRCQIKGGYTWAMWDYVIITSNKDFKEWYHRDDITALTRRIDIETYHTKV